MRLPRRPVLLLVMVAPVLIMPACDYIRSSVQPNLRLKVKREQPPSGLGCIDDVRLVDETTQQEFCVLRTPDPTQPQTQLTCHTGPVTPSTSCDCGQECGSIPGRKKRESERIMGGTNVTGSNCQHPWHVALTVNYDSVKKRLLALVEVYRERLANHAPVGLYPYFTDAINSLRGYNNFCGGSIISPNYVITAASCLFWSSPVPGLTEFDALCAGWTPNVGLFTGCLAGLQVPEHLLWGLLYGSLNIPLLPEEIAVVAGVNDLNTALNINTALLNTFKYDIEGIKIHEKYNQFMQDVGAEFKEYDIAILTVKTPFRIGESVRPICLPMSSTQAYINNQVKASGFGYKGMDDKSELLKVANMRVISMAECNTAWDNVRKRVGHGIRPNPYPDLNWASGPIKGYYFDCKICLLDPIGSLVSTL